MSVPTAVPMILCSSSLIILLEEHVQKYLTNKSHNDFVEELNSDVQQNKLKNTVLQQFVASVHDKRTGTLEPSGRSLMLQ
jgi:hypothetical protein